MAGNCLRSIMLTVIIVSWNVRDLLRGCLTSLFVDLASAAPSSARVIVVDSASTDGTPDLLRAEFPQVRLIAHADNIGFVKGNNLAMREIENLKFKMQDGAALKASLSALTSEFIWLLNPDTLVKPGATRTLIDFMRARPECGMCGPTLCNPDGSLQHGAFAFPGLAQLFIDTVPCLGRWRNSRWDGRYPPAWFERPTPFQIGFPLGAAMLVRAQTLAEVGLLDEGYEMYSEEVDWAKRMADAGWERWCVPAAKVLHYGGASTSQASARTKRILWQSRRRYFGKHYAPFKRWVALRWVKWLGY